MMGNDSIQFILWLCTAILTVGNAALIVMTFVNKARTPTKLQNERISALEEQVEELKRYLDSDNKRIKAIEEGNKVTQKGLLALMGHALNDQDDDKLLAAKDELERYLIDR
jgi:hypothetical protein